MKIVICDSANGSNRGTHDVNHIIFPEKQIKIFSFRIIIALSSSTDKKLEQSCSCHETNDDETCQFVPCNHFTILSDSKNIHFDIGAVSLFMSTSSKLLPFCLILLKCNLLTGAAKEVLIAYWRKQHHQSLLQILHCPTH